MKGFIRIIYKFYLDDEDENYGVEKTYYMNTKTILSIYKVNNREELRRYTNVCVSLKFENFPYYVIRCKDIDNQNKKGVCDCIVHPDEYDYIDKFLKNNNML